MNKLEAGQVWSKDTLMATVTNVATSYNDTYVRYTLPDGTQHETNLHTFHLYFPTEVVKAAEVVKPAVV